MQLRIWIKNCSNCPTKVVYSLSKFSMKERIVEMKVMIACSRTLADEMENQERYDDDEQI